MPGISRGKRNGQAKLTEKIVREILSSKETNTAISKRLGVDNSTVSKVRIGKTWQWLSRRNYRKLERIKHGHNPSYPSWRDMMDRCFKKTHKYYPDYGARGIGVCKRWLHFKNFANDMGKRPKGLTLERKNNDGNYEPRNCRWATRAEQSRNTRRNRFLTFSGKTLCFADWAKETGIKPYTIGSRIRSGWTVERALKEKP